MATEISSKQKAVFTEGSTMRHVLTMTSTGAVGLISIFFVDVVNLFYISLLGEQELAAAVGFASTIMFFMVSLSIGFSIAATAITAKAIGLGDREAARKNAGSALIVMLAVGILSVVAIIPLLPLALDLLGATGRTHQLSKEFMQIAVLSFPLLAIGMASSALLRAQGDAKRSMYVTLSAGFAALILDPIFIFGFDLGIHGAAWAILFIRIILMCVGLHGILVVHKMVELPDIAWLFKTLKPFMIIAVPAVLTQIATPVGNAYVTSVISEFGDDAVAGWAIVGRLMPLAFAAVFSLSGAVGPILSQNLGAGRLDRVNSAMRDSLIFALIYCVIMWALLALTAQWIVYAFSAENDSANLIFFFCYFVAGSFIFNGALFVANAAFNNLGFPIYSTAFNWGRATLGIIPFVWIGKSWGPEGVLAGWGLGGVIFGVVSVVVCFRAIKTIPESETDAREAIPTIPAANSPFTSGRGASG
ncbi:MAG: MATE family efflux transporter [Rhizobiaceae bacterium]|nr:MATE family efflux transporter [Rhizobiaceae bacterium]